MTERLLIHDVNLFAATDDSVAPHQSVLVEDATIAWVGPADAAPEVDPRLVRDGRGRTLLPGLINGHVHLGTNGITGDDVFEESIPSLVVEATLNARLTVETGVTTVRDCGSRDGFAIDFAKIVAAGRIPGPRILAAGRVITMTGGHGHSIGRQADGPWGVAAATRAELAAGADFIKIMATGGVLTKGVTPQQTALQVVELQAAVTEAHNAGKRITSHAIGGQGVKNAIVAGLDSLEHACFFDDEAIELALEHGTVIVPTLVAVQRIVDNGDTLPGWMYEKALSEYEASVSGFIAMAAAGVRVAAGTDAGTPFNPHTQMPAELELMVGHGMPEVRALAAATRVGAENVGLIDSIGTIEAGKAADLLLVDGDPTTRISDIRNVALVLAGGTVMVDAVGSAEAVAA